MAQQRLELSEAEIAEVQTRIRPEELSATQIQALVRKMDVSKNKWKKLKQQGKKDEYRNKVKVENEILFYNYPSLFDMHLEDRLDQTFFEMLQLKRKIEKGEGIIEAAIREVQEETGLNGSFECLAELTPTFHVYTFKNRSVFKQNHWFHMCYQGSLELKPQAEEGIEAVFWLAQTQWKNRLNETYPGIAELLASF